MDDRRHDLAWAGSELVPAARRGDRVAFDELAAPERDRLRLHCYRMLGSFHDAEDAVQETLLRAWLNLGRFEERSAFGTWLHRIATNTCLNLIRSRPRIVLPHDRVADHRPAAADVAWLEPYPDIPLPAPDRDRPEARVEAREATRLAFIATMQLLPPRQRAVLILRDVLSWSAAEVADALQTTVPAVNSALQRARARLAEDSRPETPSADLGALSGAAESAVDEFVRRWEACDIDGLVQLLTADAVLAMPPAPAWFRGPGEIGAFLGSGPNQGRLDEIRLVRTRANGQPALAAYMPRPGGPHEAYGLMILDLVGGRITRITGFSDARLLAAFELPSTLPPEHR